MREVVQLVDENGRYRSVLLFDNRPISYISNKRKEAMIYTEKELDYAISYYKKFRIPIMIERRNVLNHKEI
jgi:hypothetical protein